MTLVSIPIPTDETKVELIMKNKQHSVWYKKCTAYRRENIPEMKCSRGSIMIWGCFTAFGSEQLALIQGKINEKVYQGVLKDNVSATVCHLKLSRSFKVQVTNLQVVIFNGGYFLLLSIHTSNSLDRSVQIYIPDRFDLSFLY